MSNVGPPFNFEFIFSMLSAEYPYATSKPVDHKNLEPHIATIAL